MAGTGGVYNDALPTAADQPAAEHEERVRQARSLADIARRHPIWTAGFRSLIALDDEVARLEGVVAQQAAMFDAFIRSLAIADGRSDAAERTAWGLPTTTQNRPEETRP